VPHTTNGSTLTQNVATCEYKINKPDEAGDVGKDVKYK